jgi:drug/metabolite transporter (DMT)-like permease
MIQTQPSRPMSREDWGVMLLLSLVWGGSFLFNGIAVRELPVFTIVAARVTLAALALHLVMRGAGLTFPRARGALVAFLVMSVLNNLIPFNLIVFGQGLIDSGLASILNAMTPIFTMLIAHVLTADEKIGPRKAFGILLGFAGVVVLFSGRDLLAGGAVLGQAACIGATISYGFAGIFGRRFARMGLEPMVVAAGQLTLSALVMVPLALAVDLPKGLPAPSAAALAALAGLALVSTAGGYTLFFRLLARAGATNVSLVTLLIPCSAILLGIAFLGERLSLHEAAGFAVIALGLLVIDGRLVAALSGRGAPHG